MNEEQTEKIYQKAAVPSGDMAEEACCGICRVAADDSLAVISSNRYFAEHYSNQGTVHNFYQLICEDASPEAAQSLLGWLSNGDNLYELEFASKAGTGSIIWFQACCSRPTNSYGYFTCVLMDITGRKHREEQLTSSERENKIAFRLTGKSLNTYDIATQTILESKFGSPAIGRRIEEVPYGAVQSGLVAKESEQDYIEFFEAMRRGEPNGSAVVKLKSKDDTFRWYSGEFTLVYHPDGRPEKGLFICEDITEHREKEIAFERWSQIYCRKRKNSVSYFEYNLTLNVFDGVEDGRNRLLPDTERLSFTQACRYMAEHWIYEKDRKLYLRTFDREKLLVKFYEGQQEVMLEHRRKSADGNIYWAETTLHMISDPYTEHVKAFIIVQDIDAKKQEELRMKERVERDALTGLYNRGALIEKITKILEEDSYLTRHALIMLDIDHFKQLNDRMGHQFGDQALREMADSIRKLLRDGDLCGRLGGDEIVIFLASIGEQADISSRMEGLCRALTREYKEEGICLTCSLGLAISPQDGTTFGQLYRKADVALYEAKENGRNCFSIYKQS
ncbi:sensor domain-containing diguanylate cyclase [Anaerolentibacter hominis]|uniref:sensor domain-containing diguanylate cyclase n=1 Tax=Anaerolentibacter hominis TaxID=3079009 RepID=UPI0031B88F4F